LIFKPDICLRYTDPRRFGAILFTTDDPLQHPLLKNIGPEPLSSQFTGDYLRERAKNKKVAVKSYIMNGSIVAGVGNIYATEALFIASIRPDKPAGKVTHEQWMRLAPAIKTVLKQAIQNGGTTLNDFTQSDGKPGYFRIELQAYGHAGDPCPRCHQPFKLSRLGQRATVYCSHCQT
jgi:formamidopyrimidine-DNA glycosylase